MAKVEMSLNEYNAIKEELDFFRRVIKEITTPVASDWDLDYCKRSDCGVSSEISAEVKVFLESQIKKNIPEIMKSNGYQAEVDLSNVTLIRLRYEAPTEDASNEEVE